MCNKLLHLYFQEHYNVKVNSYLFAISSWSSFPSLMLISYTTLYLEWFCSLVLGELYFKKWAFSSLFNPSSFLPAKLKRAITAVVCLILIGSLVFVTLCKMKLSLKICPVSWCTVVEQWLTNLSSWLILWVQHTLSAHTCGSESL